MSQKKKTKNKIFITEKLVSYKGNISIAVKDNICVKGFPATCGSKALKDFYPTYNATIIENLTDHPYYVSGKTNMDEFAMGSTGLNSSFGEVFNPINSDFIAGGSSSGSAIAVAEDISDISLGSDTGGSVRLPAAFCGVIGYKPTYGAISRNGLIAFASSLDTIGLISKKIELISDIMPFVIKKDDKDSTSIEIKKDNNIINNLKIAYINVDKLNISNNIKIAYNETLNKINNEFTVVPIDIKLIKYWLSVYLIISSCEAASNLARFDNKLFGNKDFKLKDYQSDKTLYRSKYFGKEVIRRILTGNFALSSEYFNSYYEKAAKLRRLIANELNNIFMEFDLILSPTSPVFPLKINKVNNILQNYNLDIFTSGISLAGLPAISIPTGKYENDFKFGLQIISKFGNDYNLIEAAKLINNLF